jgi:hypothetical protein
MTIERKLSPTHEAPYRGLRVLDFGQGIASPYCAMLLGVYGADVIKVEPPEGDWSRFLGTTYGSHTTLSAVYNRGKRSLCLDMKHKDGIAIARRLAKDCDVLIEGFRPGRRRAAGNRLRGIIARQSRTDLSLGQRLRAERSLFEAAGLRFRRAGVFRPGIDQCRQRRDPAPGRHHDLRRRHRRLCLPGHRDDAVRAATVGTGRWIDVNLCQSTSALLGHKVAEHILEGGAPRALNVPAGSYQTPTAG